MHLASVLTDVFDEAFHEKTEKQQHDYTMRIDRVDFGKLRRCLSVSAEDQTFERDVAGLLNWYHLATFSAQVTSQTKADQLRKTQNAARQLSRLMCEMSQETWEKLECHSGRTLSGHTRGEGEYDLPFWNWDTILIAISTLEGSAECALSSLQKPKGRQTDEPMNRLLTGFAKFYEEKPVHLP